MTRSALFIVLACLGIGCAGGGASGAGGDPSSDPGTDPGTDPDAGASSDDASVDSGPPPAPTTYPDPPYGLNQGDTFPNLSLNGYKNGVAPWVRINMIDYYDPTGARGINAILYVVSAEWCEPCRMEAKELPKMLVTSVTCSTGKCGNYGARGAHFMTGIVQDSSHGGANQATVDRWIAATGIDFDAMADPFEKAFAGTGIPRNYIINPRDMKIVKVLTGSSENATTIVGLDSFLDSQGAPKAP